MTGEPPDFPISPPWSAPFSSSRADVASKVPTRRKMTSQKHSLDFFESCFVTAFGPALQGIIRRRAIIMHYRLMKSGWKECLQSDSLTLYGPSDLGMGSFSSSSGNDSSPSNLVILLDSECHCKLTACRWSPLPFAVKPTGIGWLRAWPNLG